jgi:CzcA family heavy metal efflux pump
VNALALLRRHAGAIWLATMCLVVLGILAAWQLPSGIYPEVEFPRIVVVAKVGGAPPDAYLTSVTRPLEQAFSSVLGVQRIRSKTIRGATEIALTFSADTDMWRALQLVESRAGEARSTLPPGTDLTVERITTGSFPVVTFNVSGPIDPRDLRDLAEFTVRPALAQVPGVGRIEVLGGQVREIEAILDPEATAALGLTPQDVADRMRPAMALSAVGRVDRDGQLVTAVADAQPRSVADIAAMPVLTSAAGVAVPLGSIAEVREGSEDRLVQVGGPRGETVGISVARLPGASTPEVVRAALAAVHALQSGLPAGVTIEPVYDQASLVQESMASVRDAILLGILLCALVISLFLRDLRAGLLAALSVPVTLAMVFAAMKVAHQTLNLMSMGGMAVAIGLVVDDAIVMIEAIAHHRDQGMERTQAALRGTAELAPAVIGTTLTTVVVFVPLAFLQGMVGDFFRALAFTVTSAVVLSLAVALVLVPLAASFGLSAQRRVRPPRKSLYDRTVRRLLGHPLLATGAWLVLLAAGVLVEPLVGRGFLPAMDEGAFVLDYFLPAGSSLAVTETFARKMQAELARTPEVANFTRRTGAELGPAAATELHRGDIMVRLKASKQRPSKAVIADLRARLERQMPEVRLEFVQVLQDVLNDLSGSPRPIEVKLLGPDYATLHTLADTLGQKLERVPGLVDLYAGRERDVPELRFAIRREPAARLGLTPDDVASQLQTALLGTTVGTVRRFDRLVGVRVRYPDAVRFQADRVLDLPLAAKGRVSNFQTVADVTTTTGPSQRLHEALQPLVDVTADHEQRDLGAVAGEVEKAVATLTLPPGYRAVLGGHIASEKATLRELMLVGALALLLVLTVLAAQFRRLRMALLVLGAVPVALVGALVGLWITGTPLNASSLMGCVLLVGLVVKNGVLLLEEAERLIEEGTPGPDAVVQASERRLRPILMTTVATLAGLLPLALGIGAGAELQQPLAITVIGGLLTSTIATLGLLPPIAARVVRAAKPIT